MRKRFLLMLAPMLLSLCAKAQSEFYVVMKDGSVQSYPSDKVDSLTFKNPEIGTIMGFGDMMEIINDLKSKVNSNCGKNNDTIPSTPKDTTVLPPK